MNVIGGKLGSKLVAALALMGFLGLAGPAPSLTFSAIVIGPSRQVTLCAIVADPNNSTIDPKLETIQGQLRKLLPNHGFRLIDVQSKALEVGQSVRCETAQGLQARSELINVSDAQGKVQLRVSLELPGGLPQFSTIVNTPPNQFFFVDQPIGDGRRLLIGIGAR